MKKRIVLFLIVLGMITLVACGSKDTPKPTGKPTTMGEALLLTEDSEVSGYEMDEEHIKVITDEYVCEAPMTKELYALIEEVPFDAEDSLQQYAKILSDLKIEKLELRADSQLTDEQISSLIGKKGQEMLDMGFESYGYNMSDEWTIFFMDRNGYTYNVTTEEIYQDSDDFDSTETFAESTIKSIELAE